MVALTEKLLQSACGWQAFKEAKSLLNAGKVLEANYAPPLLKGRVGGDGRIYASGLKINSPTDMDNLCTCRDSRDRGILCAHSIAVGLATLFVGNKTASAGGNISISQSSDSPQQTTAAVSEDIPKTSIHLEGSLNHLTAVVKFSYTDLKTRNPDFEKRVLESLSKEGFQQTRDGLRLDGEKPILRFLTSGKEKLKARADTVLGERIQRLTANVVQIEPRVAIRDTGLPGVFDANLSFTAGSDAIFSASDIRKLLQSGNTHVTLKNGKTAVMNEEVFEDIQEMLRDCDPEQSSNSFRIRSVYRKFFEESVSQWTQKAGPKKPSQPLGSLAGTLREYQKEGTQWLLGLVDEGLGGILADEMGLGKTVQAIAMLELQAGTSLVICPSALVENWRREIARFLPKTPVLVLEGSDREAKFGQIGDFPIILTSYALLRRDIEKYQHIDFKVVILDEAQHIKNPESQNARAACKLKAKSHFVLTGTPLENSIRDLWSLMEFALPGYLGGKKDFKERYEDPVLLGDQKALKRLGLRISPFLLRRMKQSVLTDLPEKIEQVIYSKLTNEQKSVYFQLQNQARDRLQDALADKGSGTARMGVFTAILRLRQTCCDLRLLGTSSQDLAAVSGKLAALREILSEVQDGGHRALVFSQFAQMLKLIETQCNADGIPYCYLDGSTKDRMAVVDRFQGNPAIPVFLISLKAGGVGLNLTGADTVIHFDPWWNPAVEAQATDRAHRIGQTKAVNVIKLVAEGTIEERVLKMQAQKRELLESALDSASETSQPGSIEMLQELLTTE